MLMLMTENIRVSHGQYGRLKRVEHVIVSPSVVYECMEGSDIEVSTMNTGRKEGTLT